MDGGNNLAIICGQVLHQPLPEIYCREFEWTASRKDLKSIPSKSRVRRFKGNLGGSDPIYGPLTDLNLVRESAEKVKISISHYIYQR